MSGLSEQDREELWQAIADVRDASPRVTNDAETWDIVAAIEPLIARHVAAALSETAEEIEQIHRIGQTNYCDLADGDLERFVASPIGTVVSDLDGFEVRPLIADWLRARIPT